MIESPIHLTGNALIEYKFTIKRLLDIMSKFLRGNQYLTLVHYVNKKDMSIYPALYLPHGFDYESLDNDKTLCRVLVYDKNVFRPDIDPFNSRQYMHNNSHSKFVDYVVTSTVIIRDIKSFKANLDIMTSMMIEPPLHRRDKFKAKYNFDVEYGISFSKHYPDNDEVANSNLSILYCDSYDMTDLNDAKALAEINNKLQDENECILILGCNEYVKSTIRVRYEQYPFKMTRLVCHKYLNRHENGNSLNMVNSIQHLENDLVVTIFHLL